MAKGYWVTSTKVKAGDEAKWIGRKRKRGVVTSIRYIFGPLPNHHHHCTAVGSFFTTNTAVIDSKTIVLYVQYYRILIGIVIVIGVQYRYSKEEE